MKNTTKVFHFLFNIPDSVHQDERAIYKEILDINSVSKSGYQDADHLKIWKASDLPFLLTYFLTFFILLLPLLSLLFTYFAYLIFAMLLHIGTITPV